MSFRPENPTEIMPFVEIALNGCGKLGEFIPETNTLPQGNLGQSSIEQEHYFKLLERARGTDGYAPEQQGIVRLLGYEGSYVRLNLKPSHLRSKVSICYGLEQVGESNNIEEVRGITALGIFRAINGFESSRDAVSMIMARTRHVSELRQRFLGVH